MGIRQAMVSGREKTAAGKGEKMPLLPASPEKRPLARLRDDLHWTGNLFGDLDDPEGLIGKVMKTTKTATLKEVKERGKIADHGKKGAAGPDAAVPIFGEAITKPRVFYIV
jgi:hypothetical protein